ncbi:MAG: DUF721 domain-containing protein [Myxococcales bacterium]|nr:DUF721 domain-containing protein [Myxococcales bacterium]
MAEETKRKRRRWRRRKNVKGKPKAIDDAMWRLVRGYVPADKIRLVLLRNVWAQVAGEGLAKRAWPEAVSGHEAIIAVHDSQWLHELTYMRQALVRRIRELAPNTDLTSVRLRLARRERPPPPPVEPPVIMPERAPPLPAEPSRETAEAIHAVDDPELREAIAAARIVLSWPPPRYPS